MGLDYDTITALINQKYMPVVYDNIFTTNNYLLRRLKNKAKTYNEREIVVDLEYAKSTTIDFLARFESISLQDEELVTAAVYSPKMLTGSITIAKEDELRCRSEMTVKNLLDVKVKNMQRSIEDYVATHIWTRGDALPDANGWETMQRMLSTTVTFGGITVANGPWWVANVIDATALDDDSTSRADLENPATAVYIKKLLQMGIARCKNKNSNPNVIIVPQSIWDLLEHILDPQKTGSKLTERIGAMGFDALDYRHIPIVADDYMVQAQTGNVDGWMVFLNDEYLYMYFNSGAKFTADEFIKAQNANYRSSLINAYGNFAMSNRNAHTLITGLWSPKTYVSG